MKKILVIGGAGFIGSNIVNELCKNPNYEVSVYDDLSTGKLSNIEAKNYNFIYGSILNKDLIFNEIAKVDVVFLLAAWARVQRSVDDVSGTTAVNINGVINVLEAIRHVNPRCKLVYSSSSSVYGVRPVAEMVETMDCNPVSPYAQQKHTSERLCMMYRKLFGLDIVALRYFNVYGHNQVIDGAYSLVIGKFLKLKASGLRLSIYGDGTQTRAYTEVRDVVNANIKAMEYTQIEDIEPVFNIGWNEEVSVNRIAELIGGEVEHIYPNPRGKYEEERKCANNEKAKKCLNWEPKITIEQGIADLLK